MRSTSEEKKDISSPVDKNRRVEPKGASVGCKIVAYFYNLELLDCIVCYRECVQKKEKNLRSRKY